MITISERREQESAKNFVLRVLIDNIVNTRLEPGEKLNEPELCEQLGVSRTPFREAELELAQRRGSGHRAPARRAAGPRSAPMSPSSTPGWWKRSGISGQCWKQSWRGWPAKC